MARPSFRLLIFLTFVVASLVVSVEAKKKKKKNRTSLPSWVEAAIELPEPPRHDKEKPGYEVLWDEAHYTVLSSGRIHQKVRYAIRINDLEERWRAKARASYYKSSGTKPEIQAWTRHSDGEVYKYKKIDQSEKTNSAYLTLETESSTVIVDGWDHTRIGDVFAYEYETTQSTIFTQYYWRFQNNSPVALSRLSITAPEDWSVEQHFFEGEPERFQNGNTITWEATNLLSKKSEPQSPTSANKPQYMIATITPPEGSKARYTNLKFDTWEDLAAFKARVSDPMAETTPEIVSKAQEITAGKITEWEKIQALGEFAKSINYEHISLELGNGGGYTPRPASETLRVGYGDCKDKTALLRALLKAVDIDSYSVTVNAIDNDNVEPDLPSPSFFNHCITAVKVSDDVDTPAVYQDDNFGRLLFIDPTWNNSPIGEIPFEAQGGLVVVGSQMANPLVKLPLSTPEQNKIVRSIQAEIYQNGMMIGRVETTRQGQPAVQLRRMKSSTDQKEFKEAITENYAANGNPSPRVAIVSESDNLLTDRSYQSTVEFAYKDYAKPMRNVLLIFKPAILGRTIKNPFTKEKRKLPIRLRSKMLEETVKFYIPVGFAADEFEKEISIETDFGSYHVTTDYDAENATINYTRQFRQEDTTLPVERYQELQDFFTQLVEAEQTPIVLARSES